MFADYESLVVADYHQKKVLNTLSPLLLDPTPARLKNECISVFNRRYNRRDETALKMFFEPKDGAMVAEQIIERYDTDKFKPLANYLKNQTTSTDRKNIELLAWLIDFQPRPYEFGRKYEPVVELTFATEEAKASNDQKGIENTAGPGGDEVNKKAGTIPVRGRRIIGVIAIASVIILLLAMGLKSWFEKDKYEMNSLTGLERCMYWTGDHYEPISCTKHGDTLVVALDSARLVNLKKISNTDTITYNAVGWVWYIKRNKQLEYYTAGGSHPEDPKLRLRPITAYIIGKHILNGQAAD